MEIADCSPGKSPTAWHFQSACCLTRIRLFGLVIGLAVACLQSGECLGAQDTLSAELTAEPVSKLIEEAEKLGDPARGAIVYYEPTMNCARCHDANPGERSLGPDLTLKREVEWAHLIESVLAPSATINAGYETVQVLTDEGEVLSGLLGGESDLELTILKATASTKPIVIPKSQIDEWKKTKLSSMPPDLANQLSNRQQFLDLIRYLKSLSEEGPMLAAELRPAGAGVLAPLPEYESRVDHAGLIGDLNSESFERGAETYRLRCASCHGTVDAEGSMPTSLRFATGKFKNGYEPLQMYQTLNHGFGMMNPQRWMVPQQKYEVIHYIREQFLKPHNPDQFLAITDAYLATLPVGDTRGPEPVVSRPWTMMNYGPSLNNTIEVSKDGSNIAQKGIVVRLDDGPGGVESGSHWMMYEHDTMRVAGAWSGGFIDWEGIHFNGAHGRHPSVIGELSFANPTGPGFGKPTAGSISKQEQLPKEMFADQRVVGRDGKHYGPLPNDWAKFLGMYRYGKKTLIKYRVGTTEILETPGLSFVDGRPVFTRTLNLGDRKEEMVIQVAKLPGNSVEIQSEHGQAVAVVPGNARSDVTNSGKQLKGIKLDGSQFAEIQNGDAFDLFGSDYSICASIKTKKDGTIFAQTKNQEDWVQQGKTLFLRDGRPTFDIGWVGAVEANRKVNDGKRHELVMTWSHAEREVQFYVDGKPAGGGELGPEKKISETVVRFGFTNQNFPSTSHFTGAIQEIQFYQRALAANEVRQPKTIGNEKRLGVWRAIRGNEILEASGQDSLTATLSSVGIRPSAATGLLAETSLSNAKWISDDQGNLRLVVPAGPAVNFVISHCSVDSLESAKAMEAKLAGILKPANLAPFTQGGPPSYPQLLKTEIIRGDETGPFAVDVFKRPTDNQWNCQLRLTGLDFLPDGDTAIVSAWDGSVWRVSGFGQAEDSPTRDELTWQRIAAGLFQPLGVKFQNGKIYVTCRDQIVILHDLNGDHEADWYENFNSDHQVTEHFHEFAMGLQADAEGNFYYAKSARHAKTAIVPHHGTLLKVSPDGATTEILANGFRAANGVCLNPDGSFVVTDQEGHWNPKNRINWVRPGEFYGNMYGYHDVTDESDAAMTDPLCWITNSFDRSPSELLWVQSEKWGPLNGSLLNFSYGYGKIYVVPHEEVDGQMQGGMCEFPIAKFPTGVMRGRFHPADGQLYCCGMFAWAGSQQQPGGLYRVRYTGQPVHLPVRLNATADGVKIGFSDQVDPVAATDVSNYSVKTWDLKRTKNYGSKHFNEQELEVEIATLANDGQTVQLVIPEIKPTWGMEINYSIKTKSGQVLNGKIHNSIFKLKD